MNLYLWKGTIGIAAMFAIVLSGCKDKEKQAKADREASKKLAVEAAKAAPREYAYHLPLSNEVDEFNYRIILISRYQADERKAYELEAFETIRLFYKVNADDAQHALDEARALAPVALVLEAAGRHEEAVGKVERAYQFNQFVVKLKEGKVYE